jgi:hypothetical protein
LFGEASFNCPETVREDFRGLGGSAGEGEAIGDVMPSPLLEEGRDGDLPGDDARRLAERIAASSSLLVGSWICEGAPVDK